MQFEHSMTSVVSSTNGHSLWVEEGNQRIERGKPRRICDTRITQQDPQNRFQPRSTVGGMARINVLRGPEDWIGPLVVRAQALGVFIVSEGGAHMNRGCDVVDDVQRVVGMDCLCGWREGRDVQVVQSHNIVRVRGRRGEFGEIVSV